MKKSFNFIIIFFIIFGLLSFIGFLAFKISANSGELSSLKKELVSVKEKTGSSYDINATINSWNENIKKLDSLFIEKELPLSFIKYVENSANESNVKAEITPTSSKDDKDIWPAVIFQIGILGKFSDVMRFINSIEAGPHFAEIQNLNFSQAGSEKGINVSMSVKVFSK